MSDSQNWKVARLDEITAREDRSRPVREHLETRAFGVNAYPAGEDGMLIGEYDEPGSIRGLRKLFAERPSGLRDHEHDSHHGKRDSAHGEHCDGAEPQRCVATCSQRMLQLTLALRADDRERDRESRVAAAEQYIGPWGDVQQFRGEPAHCERPGRSAERGAPPGQPGALRSH